MKKVLIIVLSSFVFLFTACDSSSSIDAKSLAKTKIEAEKKLKQENPELYKKYLQKLK